MWGGKRIPHYKRDDYGDDDDDDDGDDDDDVEDDGDVDGKERKIGMGMLRRMKMAMLRRKTDPKAGKHTLCECAQSKCTWTCHKSHCVWKSTGKNAGLQSRARHFVRACAVEMHMDVSQEPFFGNLQEKCRTPIPGTSFCASLRSRNAHGHFTRAILCGNLQEKCRTPRRPPRSNTGP